MSTFTAHIPLSLYIHIPWCIRKCPYCDFNSHQQREPLPEQAYITALIKDLDEDLTRISARSLVSIFIGGGTPSLFSPQSIAHLLNEIHKRLPFSENTEITLEANPGAIEQQSFMGFRAAGINRLSIGIQSFQEKKLQVLGRIHDGKQAVRAVEAAHMAGFQTFNLDLMHGLPQQSLTDALDDIKIALSLAPTHLSWYQLTIEPNTLFHHQPPALPQDDIMAEIQDRGHELLKAHGFQQYEVSAFSQPGHQSRHNLNYWEFGDYLGIGAGAHSKITDVSSHTIYRAWKVKNPKDYLDPKQPFIGNTTKVARKDLPFEFMLNAMRLTKAISLAQFEQRTGLSIENIEKNLVIAKKKGLLQWDNETIYLSPLGKRFLNDVVALFIVS